MNTDEESIHFYASCVFKYRKEGRMKFKTSIWPYLKFFLTEQERDSYSKVNPQFIHNTSGYKRIYNIFLHQIKSIHGKNCAQLWWWGSRCCCCCSRCCCSCCWCCRCCCSKFMISIFLNKIIVYLFWFVAPTVTKCTFWYTGINCHRRRQASMISLKTGPMYVHRIWK